MTVRLCSGDSFAEHLYHLSANGLHPLVLVPPLSLRLNGWAFPLISHFPASVCSVMVQQILQRPQTNVANTNQKSQAATFRGIFHPLAPMWLYFADVSSANRAHKSIGLKQTHQNKASFLVTSPPHFSLAHNHLCFLVVKRWQSGESSLICRGSLQSLCEHSLKIHFVSLPSQALLQPAQKQDCPRTTSPTSGIGRENPNPFS